STSPGTENGGGIARPPRASVFESSVPIRTRTSMIGPSGPMGTSRRGIGSEHHVGDVDHRLDPCDLLHKERDETEATPALPEGRREILEEADDLIPLDEDELALVGEQLRQARAIGRDLLSDLGDGVLPLAIPTIRDGSPHRPV